MPLPQQSESRQYKLRPLKRGDRDAAFRLLAEDGWVVPAGDQEVAISWVVQHPEMESLVAHDSASFSRLFAMMTMSHRPQLKLGGRVASIDLFVVTPEQRGRGIGHALLGHALRRAETLGCKRIELHLQPGNEARRIFFEQQGFKLSDSSLWIRPVRPLVPR